MARRRTKGSGSVYKTADGWCARRELPKSAEGKRRYERRFVATRAEARRQVAAWSDEAVAAKERHPQAAGTVRAWCQHWLVTKRDAVSERTYEFYQRHLGYATAHIGDVRLHDLAPQQIRDTLAALAARDGEPGLSPQSCKHVRTVLSMAFQLAVDDGVIARNPCTTVAPPKVEKYRAYALSNTELAAFLTAVEGYRLEAMWHLMADYGMRIEEILTCRWSDYARDTGRLRIKATKTDRERYLTLTASHVERMAAHWQQLQDERTDNPKWKEQGYLFPSEVGTKLLQSNARRAFKEALVRAGLPRRIRMHDLRHTAATNLIAAGNDIPTVQYITGHQDSAVLLEIYAHHQEERNRAAIEKVEKKRSNG
jgi:integrase